MASTQKTPRAEFLWAKRLHQENPRLHWHQHRRHYGQNSYGHQMFTWRKSLALMTSAHKTPKGRIPKVERSHEEKPLLYLTSTQKTLWAEFLWARRLHKKKNPGSHDINTEDSAGRIPMGKRSHEEKSLLYWHQHGSTMGKNYYGRNACTRRKPPTLMTLTQKTPWAEFLWARRLHKKKNPGSHDINTEDSAGRIPMGKRLHKKKNPGSHDANTEDTMGRIPMGETLTWRKPTALLTSARKTPWAEFLWANAHMKKNHGSANVNTEGTMGRIPMGERSFKTLWDI